MREECPGGCSSAQRMASESHPSVPLWLLHAQPILMPVTWALCTPPNARATMGGGTPPSPLMRATPQAGTATLEALSRCRSTLAVLGSAEARMCSLCVCMHGYMNAIVGFVSRVENGHRGHRVPDWVEVWCDGQAMAQGTVPHLLTYSCVFSTVWWAGQGPACLAHTLAIAMASRRQHLQHPTTPNNIQQQNEVHPPHLHARVAT